MRNNTQSLATKYRPTSFEDGFVGQYVTAKILKTAIENKKFKNIMLFSGSSGCGKTTAARITASLINNGVGEPIEIDAASANGVDQARAIIEAVNQRDLVGEYKIFIIDECHMITTAGWNALLKCLEECPKYSILIFCTTDPQKIPQTVLNRMQRYNFAPIDSKEICNKLMMICENEHFTNYQQACELISKTSRGCMREAITTLEKCADFSTDLSLENVKQVLVGLSYETMFKLIWALQNKDEATVISVIESLYASGQDLKHFIDVLLEFSLDLSKYKLFNTIEATNIPAYLASPDNAVVQYTVNNSIEDKTFFTRLVDTVFNIKTMIKYDQSYKATIIVLLLKFCRGE